MHRQRYESKIIVLISFSCCGFLMRASGQEAPPREIVATVGEYAITTQAAARLLEKALPQLEKLRNNPTLIEAAVERLIDRRVVYEYLRSKDLAAGENEIRVERDTFIFELSRIENTMADYLAEHQLSAAELDFEIGWRMAWNRFLTDQMTDEYLENYFREHQREYDNTEMRVAHLLIKPDKATSADQALMRANQILAELNSSKLTWQEAVEKYSSAPTRTTVGEMGWIRYSEPMPPEFSVSAFQLGVGEISSPVRTAFGVHLIRCLEIREGKTGWRDALDLLRKDASQAIFEQLAAEFRPHVQINRMKKTD